MLELKHALDAKGHCLLEMPTGTGKTITLLSLITSYQLAHPEVGKLIYCTRTVPEMEKVLAELKELMDYRARYFTDAPGGAPKILALGLSSRKNLCIHPWVSEEGSRESVDAKCMKLTAPWVRERAGQDEDIETCGFYEGLEGAGPDGRLDAGVYTLHDLRVLGRKQQWCPYFLARRMVAYANVVVWNYQYMIDPKVSQMVSREMERECVVVFDEAHNIDNVCIEALSVNLRQQTLDAASRNIQTLKREIERTKQTDAGRLRAEYQRLVQGLQAQGVLQQGGAGEADGTQQWLANPALPDDILREAVPGNIRRAEHFIAFLQRFVQHLRSRLAVNEVVSVTPTAFLEKLQEEVAIEGKTLRFCYDRLVSLMKTLEITASDDFHGVHMVADFATLVGTYSRGFAIIIEPFDDRLPSVPDPVIQLSCLDASLAMRPVFSKYQSVVITSGTLSPIDLYPRILNFQPVCVASLNMTLTRECLCPVVLTRGGDQLPVSTKFDMRSDPQVIRNYGRMLVDLAATVPDGIVCFFVSYLYMDTIVSRWNDMGILQELMQHKLVFIETQDVVETTLALDNFRRACDCGRGAVFFSVARGKVAEGIDFDRHYGRCVVMFGVPYQYTLSRILRARLEYLRETFQIKENDYLAFDAVRQAAQCVGRVIRSKADYGLMVFADKRYQRHDKRDKLPSWITQHLKDAHLNLSTDMLLCIAREFMRSMAQPYDRAAVGRSLLSEATVNALDSARPPADPMET
ncbi:DNA repair helicase UVH6 [Chlorella sorokiniana]|uniref:DNA 5'-3' helicase n=1 Tax=Chlorella sorokiniana TaxID=3076 RepID=A0A2P6U1I6_CHLSO|nr:DNA repair helicase UVH6 [Chlorella sorokiniana]|eukprot:PRW60183.1 DNA repair helicase UVH6 [Chlorella sorokiniana]